MMLPMHKGESVDGRLGLDILEKCWGRLGKVGRQWTAFGPIHGRPDWRHLALEFAKQGAHLALVDIFPQASYSTLTSHQQSPSCLLCVVGPRQGA